MQTQIERQVAEIFTAAASIGDAAARAAYIERACSGDDALRARVAKLLAADGAARGAPGTEGFLTRRHAPPNDLPQLEAPTRPHSAGRADDAAPTLDLTWPATPADADDSTRVALPSDAVAGPAVDSIAGYTLVRRIHAGGQGVVYQAVNNATRRNVAIKVMRDGPFARADERARFEREVHILAQLDHPNIVAVHDSGVAAGCQFFVMDYVSGQPLDVHMASARPDIRTALALFAEICEAVNAAHLRGVIHRDLKPGNIRIDDAGRPHILDFGLAKLTAAPDASAMTHTGEFLGSLPWASPEQASGDPARIDVRTDVYSLGVVLFQMLTGAFPYDVHGPLPDVLERIRSAAPQRPRLLNRAIDDETETIILKCLAKERERRYQSAGELARDVRRYLAGEPIEAKRDSAGYLLRKTLRRYRVQAAVVAGFAAVVLLALASSLVFWRQAETSADRATQQANRAVAFKDFVVDLLRYANPHEVPEPNVTVRAVLENGVKQLDSGTVRLDPHVAAELRATIGGVYLGLGDAPEAERQLTTALGVLQNEHTGDAVLVAQVQRDRADAHLRMYQLDEAEAAARDALERFRALLGEEHVRVAQSRVNLGCVLQLRRRTPEAEALFRSALPALRAVLGSDDLEVASTESALGLLLKERREFDEAETLLRHALSARQQRLSPEHPVVCLSLKNLAFLLDARGRSEEAIPLFTSAIETERRILEPDDPELARSLVQRGLALTNAGRAVDAELDLREGLRIRAARLEPGHFLVASTRSVLGGCLLAQGRHEEAEPLLLKGARALQANPDAPPQRTYEALQRLVKLYETWGKAGEADRWRRTMSESTAAAD